MSPDQKVLPIVIGDPSRGLRPALDKGWLATVKPLLLPAVHVKRGSAVWTRLVDEGSFRARFGRQPLESEIGCAAAHNSAYTALLHSPFTWGLVLEDDALVIDDDELHNIVSAVLENVEPANCVISLYSESPIFADASQRVASITLLRLRLAPHGAVAYMLDRAAATNLLEAQSPIASVSDWPPSSSQVSYSFIRNSAIAHATSKETSTVAAGLDRRGLVPVSARLLMWTGLWFLFHRRHFSDFGEYYEQILRPRIANKFWRPS